MSNRIVLGKHDVVSMDKTTNPMQVKTFEVIDLMLNLINRCGRDGLTSQILTDWIGKGIPCEVLQANRIGWQYGKVKISLEFIPDESKEEELQETALLPPAKPESPLDDLRAELLNNE
jgi:KGK domain